MLPPLILQPFIENAIIHGFNGIDYRGQINLGFVIDKKGRLVCTIMDNGKGRKPGNEITAQKETYHKSLALEVTQQRLSNLNGTDSKDDFEIIDLKDDKGKPCGTKVILKVSVN